LITLVVTLAINALDNDLIVYDFKVNANRTDLITRDDMDKRAYNKANLITNELYINKDNLLSI